MLKIPSLSPQLWTMPPTCAQSPTALLGYGICFKVESDEKFCFSISDCTPPFGVAIRASNEDRLGLSVAEINAMSVSGQIWDFEDANSVARGVCLNYEHKKCGP